MQTITDYIFLLSMLPHQHIDLLIVVVTCAILLALPYLIRRHHLHKKVVELQNKENEQNRKYAQLINNMPIIYLQIILEHDENGIPVDLFYLDANPSFLHLLGTDNIIGKRGSEMQPERLQYMLTYIREAEQSCKHTVKFHHYYEPKDTHFDIIVLPTHTLNVWDIFALDNTQQQQTEEKLNFTFRMLQNAIEVAKVIPWRWNLRTHIIEYEMSDPFNITSLANSTKEFKKVKDLDYISMVYPEDQKKILQLIHTLAKNGNNKIKEEYRLEYDEAEGKRTEWIELHAAIEQYDENGKPMVLIGSALVITEHKRLEEALTKAKEEAENSNKIKSAFITNMSHEIRTPLNAIVGFSNYIAENSNNEEYREYANIIKQNNELLLQLINDVFDLSNIETETTDFIYDTFDVNQSLKEVETGTHYKLPLDLQIQFCPAMQECIIYTAKNRVVQVIANFISNAIKHTPVGHIHFGYYPPKENFIRFYVKDSGCGIPKEKQEVIFKRFEKLDSFKQGSGLGLAICALIAEKMNGRIGVISDIGQGAEFWFEVPYQPVETNTSNK